MDESRELVLKNYMKSDAVIEKFSDVLGNVKIAKGHIASVLIAVRQNQTLANCDHETIVASALRAATLRLSVDPGLRQAYLVAYGGKCTLIISWKGLQDMAIRTGRYSYIQTSPIYEGEDMVQDRTGNGQWKMTGRRTSREIVGWYAGFKMTSRYGGFEASEYMSIDAINEHKEKYAKGYDHKESAWKKTPKVMQKKTVLRRLINNHGYIDPNDEILLEEINTDARQLADPSFEAGEDHEEDDVIEGEIVENDNPAEVAPKELTIIATKSSYLEACAGLGFGDTVLFEDMLEHFGNDYNKALAQIKAQHAPPAEVK